MMHMPWVIVTLTIFLLFVAGGVYTTIRVRGAHEVNGDHPTNERVSRP
jgi:hypothetical protein